MSNFHPQSCTTYKIITVYMMDSPRLTVPNRYMCEFVDRMNENIETFYFPTIEL